ncbi:MAG: vWA domain-containing protein [Gammaproteobacteria bacterium]
MLQWAAPSVFLLIPLPLLLYFIFPAGDFPHQQGITVPFYHRVEQLTHHNHRTIPSQQWLRLTLLILIWLSLITAAAGPQWIGKSHSSPRSGRDLLLAIDISGSMSLPDMTWQGKPITRLQAVKRLASDFIERRKGDRIGLILFGTRAFLQAPLTFDRTTVNTLLEDTSIGLAGTQTAIGDAIGLAIKRLYHQPYNSNKILILLTDGANNAGTAPLSAANLAKNIHLRIYTIGIGADSLLIPSYFGTQSINPAMDLDETTLKHIAQITQGSYFRARSTTDLAAIYKAIDKLEPSFKDRTPLRNITPLYPWPLLLALLLTLCLLQLRLGIVSLLRKIG